MVDTGTVSRERRTEVTRMNKAKTFKDLTVRHKSHEFVLKIYKLTRDFVSHKLFGLTFQMRRSAVSIPANNVEGFKRKGRADKLQEELDEVSRMLDGYVRSFSK